MKTNVAKLNDKQLMALFDEELGVKETADAQNAVAASTEAQAKLDSLAQVGDVMRAYYDSATQAKSAQLDSMWWRLEEALDEPAQPETAGLWSWLFVRRSHFVTGLVGAMAGALMVMALRQPTQHTIVEYRDPPAQGGNATEIVSATAESDIVEKLEIVGGTGTVMQIPGDTDTDTDTTVIWVTLSDTEGPI